MANDSEAARNGRLARCPHCRAFNGVTAKHSLAATRCSSCRTEFWYVCVEQHVFSYDKSAMSNSAWEGVVRHVPQ
ncbi:MAG TPA: hypothetical protein VGE52_15610, partial [Pirellulales bacterium]